jgi:TolB-like protein
LSFFSELLRRNVVRVGIAYTVTAWLLLQVADMVMESIAVLPFVNLSSDPEQEYFSDGISEELLNVLAQIPELRVAVRTSSFIFKNQETPIGEIAELLDVNHVLEGPVRKAGTRLRITAQLIEAENGYHLWSETYDRELEDIFAIQDEISRAIADALNWRVNSINTLGDWAAAWEAQQGLLAIDPLSVLGRMNAVDAVALQDREAALRMAETIAPQSAWASKVAVSTVHFMTHEMKPALESLLEAYALDADDLMVNMRRPRLLAEWRFWRSRAVDPRQAACGSPLLRTAVAAR